MLFPERSPRSQGGAGCLGIAQQTAAQLPPPVELGVSPRLTFSQRLADRTIAVARDTAFCFLYPANLECLAAMGARLAFFSPRADAAPADAAPADAQPHG